MIPRRIIKKIEVGPRQMTLGFEDNPSEDPDSVFSIIEDEYQKNGPVLLDGLLSSEGLPDSFDVPAILQAVFWLAQDLKIHFFVDGRIVPPPEAKQVLAADPDSPVFVGINRLVDERSFDRVKALAKSFLPDFPESLDQYSFSRRLANALEAWRDKLTDYRPLAEQPLFPGSRDIGNGLVLLDKLLENRDSHSMITVSLKLSARVVQLAETVSLLTEFYSRKHSSWQRMVIEVQACVNNLDEIKGNEEIYSKYCRLCEIIESPSPYPLVAEAEQLLPAVRAFNRETARKKMERVRSSALEKTDRMIKKLLGLFDTFESDREFRNQHLHELRLLHRRIKNSDRADEINALVNDAKDLFVDVIEEI